MNIDEETVWLTQAQMCELFQRDKSVISRHIKNIFNEGELNDDLLKKSGEGNYFSELLERIRDIRSSEKVFYRQILDIYATSFYCDPNSEISHKFFKVVQNKMHFAAHGNTAAEIIYKRADAENEFLGFTNVEGDKPKKSEVK